MTFAISYIFVVFLNILETHVTQCLSFSKTSTVYTLHSPWTGKEKRPYLRSMQGIEKVRVHCGQESGIKLIKRRTDGTDCSWLHPIQQWHMLEPFSATGLLTPYRVLQRELCAEVLCSGGKGGVQDWDWMSCIRDKLLRRRKLSTHHYYFILYRYSFVRWLLLHPWQWWTLKQLHPFLCSVSFMQIKLSQRVHITTQTIYSRHPLSSSYGAAYPCGRFNCVT